MAMQGDDDAPASWRASESRTFRSDHRASACEGAEPLAHLSDALAEIVTTHAVRAGAVRRRRTFVVTEHYHLATVRDHEVSLELVPSVLQVEGRRAGDNLQVVRQCRTHDESHSVLERLPTVQAEHTDRLEERDLGPEEKRLEMSWPVTPGCGVVQLDERGSFRTSTGQHLREVLSRQGTFGDTALCE